MNIDSIHMDPLLLLLMLAGYLAGSVSTAIITCKLMGLEDPRSSGSNNPGATNVLRIGGKKAAIITLIGDMLKGLLPVLIVKSFNTEDSAIALVAVGAFLGHLFPAYFKFEGGKGVATFFGALIGMNWQTGLTALATWLLIAFVFKYSSLAALLTALTAIATTWFFTESPILTSACLLMSSLLIWRHSSNIKRLISGEEDKIGAKDKMH